MGYDAPKVIERWGGISLRLDLAAHSINAGAFNDDMYSVTPEITLAGEFGKHVGLSLTVLGQYRNYNGAQVVDAAAELALPITLLRPEGDASPWYWQIAPLIQVGGGGSVDLAAAGLILGGGVVSGLGYNCESFEVMLANEILYYGGLPVDEIMGIHFDTQLSQLFFRNGLEGTWWIGAGFYADAGIHFTNFAIDAAAVSWYTTPTVGVGWQLGRWFDMRIAYEGDLSTGAYRSHGARVKLDFMF